jgi:hypothetical protein
MERARKATCQLQQPDRRNGGNGAAGYAGPPYPLDRLGKQGALGPHLNPASLAKLYFHRFKCWPLFFFFFFFFLVRHVLGKELIYLDPTRQINPELQLDVLHLISAADRKQSPCLDSFMYLKQLVAAIKHVPPQESPS